MCQMWWWFSLLLTRPFLPWFYSCVQWKYKCWREVNNTISIISACIKVVHIFVLLLSRSSSRTLRTNRSSASTRPKRVAAPSLGPSRSPPQTATAQVQHTWNIHFSFLFYDPLKFYRPTVWLFAANMEDYCECSVTACCLSDLTDYF